MFRITFVGFQEAIQKLSSLASNLKDTVLDAMEEAANNIIVPKLEARAPPYANLVVRRGPDYVTIGHEVKDRTRPWRGVTRSRRTTLRESSRAGRLYGRKVKPVSLYSIFEEIAYESKEEVRSLIVDNILRLLERI